MLVQTYNMIVVQTCDIVLVQKQDVVPVQNQDIVLVQNQGIVLAQKQHGRAGPTKWGLMRTHIGVGAGKGRHPIKRVDTRAYQPTLRNNMQLRHERCVAKLF